MEKQNTNTEKLTDKAFSRLILTSVLGILLCMTCLCSATWAWFNSSVEASGNKLASGSFGLDVSVADSTRTSFAVVKQADGTSVCTLPGVGLYTVTLELSGDTTVTKGFCSMTTNGKTYKTALIKKGESDVFSFTLDARVDNLAIVFSPRWGMPSSYDVAKDGVLVI